MTVSNWGLYPRITATEIPCPSINDVQTALSDNSTVIGRGLGRCYGDSALNDVILSMRPLNNIISFDSINGIITCESGVSFSELLPLIINHGWFLPVTPGTQFVTVGGAVAANVHGKNHHSDGDFCNFVLAIQLIGSGGQLIVCRPGDPYFDMTCGGMGLTGIITQVTFSLKPIETPFIAQKTLKLSHLDETMRAFDQYHQSNYAVAWLDCLATGSQFGRSVLLLGNHASQAECLEEGIQPTNPHRSFSVSVPFFMPLLGTSLNRIFNAGYFLTRKSGDSITHYQPYFYPLDTIRHWNRLYGKNGFFQYQCVFPLLTSHTGLSAILQTVQQHAKASFLCVLKKMGPTQCGVLSFPMEGFTLALDFPINPSTLSLCRQLDRIVLDNGGRHYLAKDSQLSKAVFWDTYPDQARAFRSFRESNNLVGQFESLQSRRLGL